MWIWLIIGVAIVGIVWAVVVKHEVTLPPDPDFPPCPPPDDDVNPYC